MECKVCLHPYDQSQRRPRVLPCGHTFCDKCVEHLLKDGSLTCPTCTVQHSASGPSQFPFSFELEELLLRMQEVGKCPKPQNSEHTAAGKGLSQMLTSLVEKQMSSASKSTSDCKKLVQQLERYEAHLDRLVKEQEDCLAKFADIIEHHKGVLICQRKRASSLRETGLKHEQQLKTASKALETATSAREVADEFDRTDKTVVTVHEWAEKSRETFLDTSVYKSVKIHAAMMEGLKLIGQELEDGTDILINPRQVNEKCNVQEILKRATTAVTMSGLWEMAAPVRRFVQAGQVVAVQLKDNLPKYSRITMDKDAVCMHRLQRGHPREPFTYTVPHHRLRDWADTDTLTFLDLSWSRSPRRRVYIRVNPEENKDLAEQFVLMCTAEKGPSFAGTQLSKFEDRPLMVGGDYDNAGGKAIVTGIKNNKKTVQCTEGMVNGYWLTGESPGTRFTITTKTCKATTMCCTFGFVVEGIEVIKQAPKASPITVVDCGIVVKEDFYD